MFDFVFDIFWTDFRPSDGKIGDLMLENRSPKMSKIFLHLRSKKICSSFFLNKGSILTGSALPVVALRSTYYQPFVILCSNFRCLDRSLIPTLIFFLARSTSNLVGQSVRPAIWRTENHSKMTKNMSTKHTHIACNLMFIMSYCRMFSLHTLPMSIYYECNTLSPPIKFCSTHFEASQRLMIDYFFDIFGPIFDPQMARSAI